MKATVRSGRAMGSSLRLTLPGYDDATADGAWAIVASTFEEAERALTRFDAGSALSRLNRSVGASTCVPPMLGRALAAAWRAFRVTGGRFDPRIIGALEVAGERAGVSLPASPARLDPDDCWLWLESRLGIARLEAPIDLGGIGKGLALRWAARRLRRAGFGDFLVAVGGDLVAAGRGPAQRPWSVSLQDPSGRRATLATIELPEGGGLATSSIAVRSWTGDDGQLCHHLIDPATQRPAEPVWLSVTVATTDPAWAEVLSKVGFLAGGRIGEVLGGRRAWWVAPDGGRGAVHTGRRSLQDTTLGPVDRALLQRR